MRLGILFGGRSGEHEISLLSAASVIRALNRDKFEPVTIGITKEGEWLLYDGPVENIEDGSWEESARAALEKDPETYGLTILGTGGKSLKDRIDFALPVLHGPYGEDGTIQGLFEMIDIPYGGSGVTGSALAMDKALAKEVFARNDLPQLPWMAVLEEEFAEVPDVILDWAEERLKWPIFVKPANMGSSVGITKAYDRTALKESMRIAFEYDRKVVLEQGADVRELETGILGNYDPDASVAGEIIPAADFYDYKAKYQSGDASRLCIPAELTEEEREEIRELALAAYEALDCAGFARVDIFKEKETGKLYINEINTIPGFTRYSMFPLLWGAAGIPYPEQIERIVTLGYERYHAKNRRKTNI
ncbi:MAG: D-alanine--D-alanine ligase family protein [Anaerovoracaceae bacterium]|nr:D-alanine--D-alanine ligase [Bacillota bacterium]MDY3953937.1 D-alanine--D-alanine ligase family protein [Anaerovoracaceae bacterium]